MSSVSRYISIARSSIMDTASRSRDRQSCARLMLVSGIGFETTFLPRLSGSKYRARIVTRSMTPSRAPSSSRDPAPIGTWTATGSAPSRVRICSIVRSKSAPMRSILLMKQIRGTPYRSACRHTVSLCASTPSTALNTTTAPSRTRRLRSTSAVKSTCPGVSMMLIVTPSHSQVTAAE